MEQILVVVDIQTDVVNNVIVWAGLGEYDPGSGYVAIPAPGAIIGWYWNNGEQVETPPVGE